MYVLTMAQEHGAPTLTYPVWTLSPSSRGTFTIRGLMAGYAHCNDRYPTNILRTDHPSSSLRTPNFSTPFQLVVLSKYPGYLDDQR